MRNPLFQTLAIASLSLALTHCGEGSTASSETDSNAASSSTPIEPSSSSSLALSQIVDQSSSSSIPISTPADISSSSYQSISAPIEYISSASQPPSSSGTGDPGISPANILTNGDFSNGTIGWVIEKQSPATATSEVVAEGPSGGNALRISVTTIGASPYWYEVQANYPFALEIGKTYTLSFWAKTDVAGYEICAVLSQNHAPWGHHIDNAEIYPILTTDWQEYTFTWTSTVADEKMRISLGNLAKVAGQTFWFADVRLY